MTDRAKVYLVGAGPGDPDLLTVKALRLIQDTDTIVYDRLVSKEILRLIPKHVSQIYVGKTTGRHTLKQEEINDLLVDLANKNQNTVRLKGGDPFIFGRGSEEALALVENNIPFEIVPGITAAQACAAYAGIPLTHRGLAHSVQFVTGHRKNNEAIKINNATLNDPQQTLVIYMGLSNVAAIIQDLLQAGREKNTPVAIIEQGTTPRHRQHITSISMMLKTIKENNIQSPVMLIVGEVVNLSYELNWFIPIIETSKIRYA